MTATNPATVAARLAAARVRVRPLDDWISGGIDGEQRFGNYCVRIAADGRVFVAMHGSKLLRFGTRDECIAACDANNGAAVLAMLEVIPSEESQP